MTPGMRIELFGIARARAERDVIEVTATNLRDAVRGLAQACPGLVPEVIDDESLTSRFLASLNGERFITDLDTELREEDTLLILGAQMGG